MPMPPSLRELQRDFADALIEGEAPGLVPWIAARGIDPHARLRIYRHAGYAIHVDALEAVFPAVRALVGEDSFDGLATRYTARHGSTSGNLQHFGCEFADFLAAQPELEGYAWLPHVAHLEWLRQESLLAAQATASPASVWLEALQQAGAGALYAHLQPHVRYLQAPLPVLDVWQWTRHPQQAAPDLQGPAQHVLLWRHDTRVEMQAVSASSGAFLAAVLAGRDLADALPGGAGVLETCIAPLIEHGLLARIVTTPAPPARSET